MSKINHHTMVRLPLVSNKIKFISSNVFPRILIKLSSIVFVKSSLKKSMEVLIENLLDQNGSIFGSVLSTGNSLVERISGIVF